VIHVFEVIAVVCGIQGVAVPELNDGYACGSVRPPSGFALGDSFTPEFAQLSSGWERDAGKQAAALNQTSLDLKVACVQVRIIT
jgi:hypothetical protein